MITEVVLPPCRLSLAVTLILTWVFAWNEYLLAATLTNFNARTPTTGLSEYVTTTGTGWSIIVLGPRSAYCWRHTHRDRDPAYEALYAAATCAEFEPI